LVFHSSATLTLFCLGELQASMH